MNDNIVLPIPNLSTENENKKVPKTGQILATDWEKCDLYFKSKRLFVVYVEWIYFSLLMWNDKRGHDPNSLIGLER